MSLDAFRHLFEPELLLEMEQYGERLSFREGDVIMDYGKYVRMLPIVLKGTVKVMRMEEQGPQEILLYYLSSSESCSMAYSCCLEARKSRVRAVAEDEVEILAIPNRKLEEWLCVYPGWKNYVFRSFSDRFDELIRSIENIAFHRLDERLVEYLREKKRISGSSVIHVSHHQIADELATSRVVVSRLLKQLENARRILLYRNEIKLLGEDW